MSARHTVRRLVVYARSRRKGRDEYREVGTAVAGRDGTLRLYLDTLGLELLVQPVVSSPGPQGLRERLP